MTKRTSETLGTRRTPAWLLGARQDRKRLAVGGTAVPRVDGQVDPNTRKSSPLEAQGVTPVAEPRPEAS